MNSNGVKWFRINGISNIHYQPDCTLIYFLMSKLYGLAQILFKLYSLRGIKLVKIYSDYAK